MNLCLFFEGTGRGVAGCITNVTRLRDLCVDDSRQKLHLEAGPGTHFGSYLAGKIAGVDWRTTFRSARRWFEANYESLPKDGIGTSVFLFGFSRGALIARHFAAWLDKLGVEVDYLGLWDTVDATIGLDVAADCPRNVKKARHAVSRDETRKFFQYVPLKAGAKRAGVRFRRGADLSQRLDIPSVVLHDSHSLASNLWGAFDRVKRDLPRLRLHFACKGL